MPEFLVVLGCIVEQRELDKSVLQRRCQGSMSDDEDMCTVLRVAIELLEELLATTNGLVDTSYAGAGFKQ
ncbi:hypothetical protein WJ28_16265 [Burkholderia thailandensis]|nr:hypothetical protein WJ27_00120 [Burkholderia thailandensis]KVG14540.1 hypothetical protein WJ28_16265 [Burkholderia thailandensis]